MTGRIVVVGLGPGDPSLVTSETLSAIGAIPNRFLRTRRHPSAGVVGEARSFDGVYETADTFASVYSTIVAELVAAAGAGDVLYAVPGSPFVAETTVALLRSSGASIDILPALSFVDLAWDRLGIDPFDVGARLVDGHRFATDAAGQTGPLLVGQCDRVGILSDIKLLLSELPSALDAPLIVLQRLGLRDESVTEVAWEDLDRIVVPDHLTSVWIPRLAAPIAGSVVALVELVETLRQRCPWDSIQTHRTLARHLLEETYEVLEAIEGLPASATRADADTSSDETVDDAYAHLEEELGDLLFQVVFHSRLGTEAGRFDLSGVAQGIHDKLYARHPHVFGSEEVTSAADLNVSWEQRKKLEKGRTSVMDGIPIALPALAYAEKVQRKAASLRLDWPDVSGIWAKVDEELGELRDAIAASAEPAPRATTPSTAEPPADVVAELGDVLFTVVNLARKSGVEAEDALRAAANRFRRRVGIVEELAAAAGVEPAGAGAEQLDRWWEEAKRRPASLLTPVTPATPPPAATRLPSREVPERAEPPSRDGGSTPHRN